MINSVQGVEGALKYDPTTGCLVAAVSAEKLALKSLETVNQDAIPSSSTPGIEAERTLQKLELDDSSVGGNKMETSGFPTARKCEIDRACTHQTERTKQAPFTQQAEIASASIWSVDSKDTYYTPYFAKDGNCDGNPKKGGLSLGMFECQITPKSSDSIPIDVDALTEHSHPTSSSMTDSSSGSASSHPTFKKSSKEVLASNTDGGTTITVKATYKDDTVRFKFIPSNGCPHLFEEIGKRYKLAVGTFQLKYMDDEDEWVRLSSHSDLLECVEVLESVGSRNLKLLVRDVPCSFGSSGGSNFLQA